MKKFIFLVGVRYQETMKQRPHHMVDYLTEMGYTVYYIGYDSKKVYLSDNDFNELFLETNFQNYIEEIKTNLFDLPHIIRKNKKQVHLISEFLNKLEDFLGTQNTVVYVGHPSWLEHIISLSSETKIIYDCMDDWEEFVHDLGFGIKKNVFDERKLASISDLVIVSAKKLFVKMYPYSNNIYYMPNGVKSDDYKIEGIMPEDMKSIAGPIVVFMGTITGWVDLNLMKYIADRRPMYNFVYLGNIVEVEKDDIPRNNNIHYLGKKKYSELVNYLKYSRVAIIPFKENRLTASVSPLKFYEYISAGLPTVSTMLPDLLGVEGAYVNGDYEGFLSGIDYYVSLNDEVYMNLKMRLTEASKVFEWSTMMDNLLDCVFDLQSDCIDKNSFVSNTISFYQQFNNNSMIRNELLSMYSVIGDYEKVIEVGESLKEELGIHELLHLSLSYLLKDEFEKSVDLLKLFLSKQEFSNFNLGYLNHLLDSRNASNLIEVLLLKYTGNYSCAILRCFDLLDLNYENGCILSLLSALYFEMGEYDIGLEYFSAAIENIDLNHIKDFFMAEQIVNIVDFLIDKEMYELAENICFIIMDLQLDELAIMKLGSIYLLTHIPNDD